MSMRVDGRPHPVAPSREEGPVFSAAPRARSETVNTHPVSFSYTPKPERLFGHTCHFTILEALREMENLTPEQRAAAYFSVPKDLRNTRISWSQKSAAPGDYISLSYLGQEDINYTDQRGVTKVVNIPSITIEKEGLKRIRDIRKHRGEPIVRWNDDGDPIYRQVRAKHEAQQAAVVRQHVPPPEPRASATFGQ
jgi:hypothetical protein